MIQQSEIVTTMRDKQRIKVKELNDYLKTFQYDEYASENYQAALNDLTRAMAVLLVIGE